MLKAFTIVRCWVIAAVVGVLSVGQAAGEAPGTPDTQPAAAAVIALKGPINAYSQGVFVRQFQQAKTMGANVIIVELDTYGGAVKSALELSHFIKAQADVRTIAYVNPKAYSAGAMIALACNQIVMAPAAATGDCAPIAVGPAGGVESLGETERAKIESPILADFENSARRNGYDPLLVQSMVALNRVVYWVQKDGQKRFVDEKRYEQLAKEGWEPVEGVANPVDRADTLLTVSTEQAIKLGLAKGVATSAAQLARERGLSIIATFDPGFGDQVLGFLNHESMRLLLMVVFLVSLYVALHAPGHGLAEAMAVLSLGALLTVPLMTGYAQWWEVVAVLLGISLLALELFVIPGFGVAGLLGIALILVGLTMTFVAPEPGRSPLSIPRLPVTWASLQHGLAVVVGGLITSLLLCWWLRQYLPKLPYFSRLILTTIVGSESAMVGSLTNIDPLDLGPAPGASGIAVTDLRPGGSAEFHDAAGGKHIVSVVSDSGYVVRGTRLVVKEVTGNRIVVRAVRQES